MGKASQEDGNTHLARASTSMMVLKRASVVQAYAVMIGDSPADDARSLHTGPDRHADNSREEAEGLGGAPLAQPGDEFRTSNWLVAVLRWVRWGCVALADGSAVRHSKPACHTNRRSPASAICGCDSNDVCQRAVSKTI